jgi:hypothetical protein
VGHEDPRRARGHARLDAADLIPSRFLAGISRIFRPLAAAIYERSTPTPRALLLLYGPSVVKAATILAKECEIPVVGSCVIVEIRQCGTLNHLFLLWIS